MTDLYAILGAKKRASKAALRAAHRKRAMETHPDRGGDGEAFKAVQRAYAILSDDSKRKRYDETGEGDDGPDNAHRLALGVLAEVFQAALVYLVSNGKDLARQPLVAHMRRALTEKRVGTDQPFKTLTKACNALRAVAGRFTGKGVGAAFLERLAQDELGKAEAGLKQVTETRATIDAASEMLKGIEYRQDPATATVSDLAGFIRTLGVSTTAG